MRHKGFIFIIPIVLLALLISVPLVMAKGPTMRVLWALAGNTGTDATTDFLGTTDAQDLVIKTNAHGGGGEVARFTSGGDFIVDTDTLFVDNSADSVGIGTTTPSAKLDVVGTTRAQW